MHEQGSLIKFKMKWNLKCDKTQDFLIVEKNCVALVLHCAPAITTDMFVCYILYNNTIYYYFDSAFDGGFLVTEVCSV